MNHDMKIFSGSSAADFTWKICSHLGIPAGNSDVFAFSEGNTFVRINEPVRGKDVYLVQSIGLRPNDELVDILFWLDAFKRASAKSVTAIIPYFGYGKGDKKDEPRVSIRARVCAECIELVGADRIITMDLHSPQIQGFFKKPADNLQSRLLLPFSCKCEASVQVATNGVLWSLENISMKRFCLMFLTGSGYSQSPRDCAHTLCITENSLRSLACVHGKFCLTT